MVVNVNFKNCYGIKDLEYSFEFDNNQSTYAIYAPNGVMKTSFAKVFEDYSKSSSSCDLLRPDRETTRDIIDEQGNSIPPESIFVINRYNEQYQSNKLTTLLVNAELKKKYEELHKSVQDMEDMLLRMISTNVGLRDNVKDTICSSMGYELDEFPEVMKYIYERVNDGQEPQYADIKYSSVLNKDVKKFLETKEFRDNLIEYVNRYEQLLNKTKYLKVGFDHYNAETIHKSLKSNKYFEASHTITLFTNEGKQEISSQKELIDIINSEKNSIFEDEDLKRIFNKLDNMISNAALRDFRTFVFNRKEIIPELLDIDTFEKNYWMDHIKSNIESYNNLIEEYKLSETEINKIIAAAKEEKTRWEQVIEIFNSRFFVPFTLKLVKKEDSIIKEEAPAIEYFHEDSDSVVEKRLLTSILSQGELRALYLLNIIFEIESRKSIGIETILIIDDIADSFDYKNKYAIVQYLKEMSRDNAFKLIVLTHNFDFFRTIQERLDNVKYADKSLMASKSNEKIELIKVKASYIGNPFNEWKEDLTDKNKMIASIPFARNLCDYIGDENMVTELTALLHRKRTTNNISVADLESKYKDIFRDLSNLCLPNKDEKVVDVILNTAAELANETIECLDLEKKIVLSIGIRLIAEEYMITEINDMPYVSSISSAQTGKLFGKFKKVHPTKEREISVLDKVNLMTAENIHLNSFMFEPILDLSSNHLKQLYHEVKAL